MKKLLFLLSISSLLFISCEAENDEWISLFDGNTLDGWEMKIKGYELNITIEIHSVLKISQL